RFIVDAVMFDYSLVLTGMFGKVTFQESSSSRAGRFAAPKSLLHKPFYPNRCRRAAAILLRECCSNSFRPCGNVFIRESFMSVKTNEELEKLKVIGQIVRKTLDAMKAAARRGVSTAELDQIGLKTLAAYGAEPAPSKVYGFPGAVCISVNEEAV